MIDSLYIYHDSIDVPNDTTFKEMYKPLGISRPEYKTSPP